MGWPKGKPRGPRKPKDSSIKALLDSGIGVKTPASADDDEDGEKESNVIVVDKLGFWGISMDVRNVIVMKRSKYTQDETIVTNIASNETIKEVKAGDWTAWKHERGNGKGPYYGSIEAALKYIQKGMVKAELRENGNLDVFLAASKRSEERIEAMLTHKKDK